MREDVAFNAEGVTLRGWLYLPDRAREPVPTIVMRTRRSFPCSWSSSAKPCSGRTAWRRAS